MVPERKMYPQAKEVHLNTTKNDTYVRKTNPSGQLLYLYNFLVYQPIQKRYMTSAWKTHTQLITKWYTKLRKI
jgi:hypothetical protein